jgi:tetratricopeptide (TPR) repeat protein
MSIVRLKFFHLILLVMASLKSEAQTSDLGIADSLYQLGNHAEAINYYAKVGTLKSDIQIANAYAIIGNYDKAILQYESVVSKDKEQIHANFELGKLYLKTKKATKALEVFQQLAADQPENPEFYFYKGRAWQDVANVANANKAFKEATRRDSTHLRSIYQLGKYHLVKRNLDSVHIYIDMGLQFYENDVALLNLKALAYFNANKLYWALPIYEQLLELGEKTEYIYEKLGILYDVKNENENEKSKLAYQRFLDLDHTNPKALFGLGNAYMKLKVLDSAAFYIKESIVQQQIILDKEYNALARISVDQGDLRLAIDYYKNALQEDPEGYLYKYEICFLTDQFYKDPKMKLGCYKSYIETFGKKKDYFSEFAQSRINELKEEIHFEK